MPIQLMFHKIGTPLFSFYNFSKCRSILMKTRETMKLLKAVMPDFYPPNSMDLNPVNYKIWATLYKNGCKSKVSRV